MFTTDLWEHGAEQQWWTGWGGEEAGKGGWWDVREESDGDVEWTISKTSSCLFQACSSTSSTVWVPASRASGLRGGTASGRSWNIHRGCEQTWGKLHGKLKGHTMGGGWGMANSLTKQNFFKGWARLNLETVAWRLPAEISQDPQNTVWWDDLSSSVEQQSFSAHKTEYFMFDKNCSRLSPWQLSSCQHGSLWYPPKPKRGRRSSACVCSPCPVYDT